MTSENEYLMVTLSEENYLKTIFHLQKAFPQGVSTNALAERMESKASSVTEMVKKLSEKQLVKYKKYQGVKLSGKGESAAIEIVRRHRLWEFFLVEKLNFSWSEVHEVAEQLEHVQSKKLTRELDKFLGFPRKDPHGDPIPDQHGVITASEKYLLAELQPGDKGICVGVKDSSKEFLEYLDRHQIALGKEIKILEKEDFDSSMLLSVDGKELHISKVIANNLYLKTEPENG